MRAAARNMQPTASPLPRGWLAPSGLMTRISCPLTSLFETRKSDLRWHVELRMLVAGRTHKLGLVLRKSVPSPMSGHTHMLLVVCLLRLSSSSKTWPRIDFRVSDDGGKGSRRYPRMLHNWWISDGRHFRRSEDTRCGGGSDC